MYFHYYLIVKIKIWGKQKMNEIKKLEYKHLDIVREYFNNYPSLFFNEIIISEMQKMDVSKRVKLFIFLMICLFENTKFKNECMKKFNLYFGIIHKD